MTTLLLLPPLNQQSITILRHHRDRARPLMAVNLAVDAAVPAG
jgi:hypothetical protein